MKEQRRIERPMVVIAAAEYEGDAIKEALELLSLAELITPSDTVVITPNWVKPATPQTGTVVGPESLRACLVPLVRHPPAGKQSNPNGSGSATTTGSNCG